MSRTTRRMFLEQTAPTVVDELIPVGPLRAQVRISEGVRVQKVKFLVAQQRPPFTLDEGEAVFQFPSLLDHEVIVLE